MSNPAKKRKTSKSNTKRKRVTDFNDDDGKRIFEAGILTNGCSKHHQDSFSDFMNTKIGQVLNEHPDVTIVHENKKHVIEIAGVRYNYPSIVDINGEHRYIYPEESHIRHIAYTINMYLNIKYKVYDTETEKLEYMFDFRDCYFDSLPCMKGSEFCTTSAYPDLYQDSEYFDIGGYFITENTEKAIIGQEGPRNNYPFVSEDKDGNYKCEIRSFNETRHRATSTLYIHLHPNSIVDDMKERRIVPCKAVVEIPFMDEHIPLVVMFKVFGIVEIEDILNHLIDEENDPDWFQDRVKELLVSEMDAVLMSQDDAILYLANERNKSNAKSATSVTSAFKKRKGNNSYKEQINKEDPLERARKQVASLISLEILPHQGFHPSDVKLKSAVFVYYVRKILNVYYGFQSADRRDHYMNRFVSLDGQLMIPLVRHHWTTLRKRLASSSRKQLENGQKFIDVQNLIHGNIGSHLIKALNTGNFSVKSNSNNMDGVSQALSRIEPFSAIAHLNRQSNPQNKDGHAVDPCLQDESIMGISCPHDTPEGKCAGLTRNMPPLAGIRSGYVISEVKTVILITCKNLIQDYQEKSIPVFISGILIGSCKIEDSTTLLNLLKERRSTQDLPFNISIYKTNGQWKTMPFGEIHINVESGSYYWPLIRIDKLDVLQNVILKNKQLQGKELWTMLTEYGVLDYMNKDEEVSSARIALTYTQLRDAIKHPELGFTHTIIHPSQTCSIYSAKVPLLEFNQAPRVTYATCMTKSAIGRPLFNSNMRFDSTTHELFYPQRPLVRTFMDDILYPDGVISVENVCVAMCNYNGFGIEDSIIMKREFLERGGFRSNTTKSIQEIVAYTNPLEYESLEIPKPNCQARIYANYDKINHETGTVDPGMDITKNDVIISKMAYNLKKKKIGKIGDQEEIAHQVRDRSRVPKTKETSVVEEVCFTKNLKGDQVIRMKTTAMRAPEIGDKFACLTQYHKVLVKHRGWVFIDEIKVGDQVASMNNFTMKLEYKEVYDTMIYDGDQAPSKLYEGIMCCTGNHKQPILNNNKIVYVDTKHLVEHHESYEHVVHAKLEENLNYEKIDGYDIPLSLKNKYSPLSIHHFLLRIKQVCNIVDPNYLDYLIELCVISSIEYSLGFVNDCFTIKFKKPTKLSKTILPKREFEIKKNNKREAVYCISVEDNHNFFTSYNFETSLTSNSRHGQKGTVGKILNEKEMPFCLKDGSIPDIIINPHGITSRMTLGHLLEMLLGKLVLLSGEYEDGTPYSFSQKMMDDATDEELQDDDFIINKLGKRLEEYGYNPSGKEVYVDGLSGKKLELEIFSGYMSYMRLKHMTADKCHPRSRGPIDHLTRQPKEGRHNDGGQRFGEMERDCVITHGASGVLLDRLATSSDATLVPICKKCGNIAQPPRNNGNLKKPGSSSPTQLNDDHLDDEDFVSKVMAASINESKPFCGFCLEHDTVKMVSMPYATKLVLQQMQGLHMSTNIILND